MEARHLWFAGIAVLIVLAFAHFKSGGSSSNPQGPQSSYYKAACHGPPVHGVEERAKAMQEGYTISNTFDCITQESWEGVQQQKAEYAASHTPEAIARREAEDRRRYEE